MSPGLTKALQAAVALLGAAALAFLLIEPRFEGRNAHATVFEIYFKDPFLAYAYAASIPFFIGLHQAFKALGGGDAKKALRTIRHCALAVAGFVTVSFAFMGPAEDDDRPQGIVMRFVAVALAAGTTAAVAKLERHA